MDPIADLPAISAEPDAHPLPSGNPTPSLASNGAHPPYAEMIVAAIAALKDRDGSSRQAIAKYIEKEYANLPPTHSTLLTHHLKRLKNQGQLLMVKHSYMLPLPRSVPFQPSMPAMDHSVTDYSVPAADFASSVGVNSESSSLTPKRRPGRPPKPRPDFGFQVQGQAPEFQPYQTQFDHHLGSGQDLQSHYGSGQEFQGSFAGGAEPIFVSLGLADDGVAAPPPPPENAPGTAKRGRGRPPKRSATGDAAGGSVVTSSGGDVGGDPAGGLRGRRRKPGRPKLMSIMMVNGGGAKRARGRPKRIGMGPVTVPLSGNVLRGRGRPKRAGRPAKTLSVNGGNGESVSASRQRGRPPKSGKLNGQSFGGPSKAGPGTAVLVTDPQQLVAYQELKSKYEHLQSKAKEVLTVVKPYINSEYAAFGALHELEALVEVAPSAPSEKPPSFG